VSAQRSDLIEQGRCHALALHVHLAAQSVERFGDLALGLDMSGALTDVVALDQREMPITPHRRASTTAGQ
jgi:hypothetical protein